MKNHVDIRRHTGRSEPKHYKATLFEGDHLMLGVNCLEPGQAQRVHTHAGQDKFYFVVEGEGSFTIGTEEVRNAGPGTVVWAPAGSEHGVLNEADRTLVLLMGIGPPPG
jgi:quercetin dioxygenase-like cupin family protein